MGARDRSTAEAIKVSTTLADSSKLAAGSVDVTELINAGGSSIAVSTNTHNLVEGKEKHGTRE